MKIQDKRAAWITVGIIAYFSAFGLAWMLKSGILVVCLLAPLILAVTTGFIYFLYCIVQAALDTSEDGYS